MATKRTTKKVTDTVAKAAKTTAAKVEAAIPAAEAVVKDTAAKVSAAAEPVVKEAAAKAETVKEAAAAVKKAAGRKTAAKKEAANAAVYVQYLGREFCVADVVANVKKIWTDEMGKKESDICGLKVYVKPEENKAYYVINDDVTGSVEL